MLNELVLLCPSGLFLRVIFDMAFGLDVGKRINSEVGSVSLGHAFLLCDANVLLCSSLFFERTASGEKQREKQQRISCAAGAAALFVYEALHLQH